MEERIFCQCCGMPLDAPEDMGSNADGSPNRDYCRWCYQRGAFTAPEATVEDMIAFDLKFNEGERTSLRPQEEAERLLRAWLPHLEAVAEVGNGNWGRACGWPAFLRAGCRRMICAPAEIDGAHASPKGKAWGRPSAGPDQQDGQGPPL